MAEEFTNTAEDVPVTDEAQAENASQRGTPHKEQESDKADAIPVMGPQAENFWENSVDARLINLSESEAPPQDDPGEQTASPAPVAEEAKPEEHKTDTPLTEDAQEEPQAEAALQPDNDEVPSEEKAVPDESPGEDITNAAVQQEVSDLEVVAENETGNTSLSDEDANVHKQEEAPQAADEELSTKEEEPDEEASSDEEVSQQAAGFLKKKWVAYGCGAVLLVVMGLVLFFKSSSTSDNHPIQLTAPSENTGDLYTMKFFLPLDVDNERFVKATVAVALADQNSKQEIDRKLKDVRKHIIDLMLNRSIKKIREEKEINILRQEITANLNQFLLNDCIKDTYFTELVVL